MTVGRKNPKGIIKKCMLCDGLTKNFLKAHIPRGNKNRIYWVHPKCEKKLNYLVSPRDQEYLTLEGARWIIKYAP